MDHREEGLTGRFTSSEPCKFMGGKPFCWDASGIMVIMRGCRSCVVLVVTGRFWVKGWSIPTLLGRFRAWSCFLAFEALLARGIGQ